MTMTLTHNNSYHEQEVTRLQSSQIDSHGFRMDVNLWFRHKNEALFYIDSVSKVHGPMDQTYSIKLGSLQKSGKKITLKNKYLEESGKNKWRTYNEFQRDTSIKSLEENKHKETLLRDVSSSGGNNCQKSYLTTATHYIPRPSRIEVGDYSSSITKQGGAQGEAQGVTVNLKVTSKTNEDANIRERRLIDELLETRNELNTLRRSKSVIDASITNDHSSKCCDVNFVRKIVTDVQPSMERVSAQQLSSLQEITNKDLPQVSQMSSIQKSKNFVESHSISTDSFNRTLLNDMRLQQMQDKPITVTSISSNSKSQENNTGYSSSISRTVSASQDKGSTVYPVQSIEVTSASQDEDELNTHEEKIVTIKRKITRRKKGSEKVDHLRDSYIEKISSPLPTYDSTSDTDDSILNNVALLQEPIVSKVTSLKEASAPFVINEEVIVPQKKGTIASAIVFDFMTKLDPNGSPSPDLRQGKNTSDSKIQYHQPISETTRETFINDRQMAPVSTYSARKENVKSKQLLDERNLGSRTLQAKRSIGRRNEMIEEIETITLQPIGKGVQDLAPPSNTTMSRSGSRAVTPKAFDAGTVKSNYYREESKQSGNYNTMPAMPRFTKINSVRNVNQASSYDISDFYQRGNSSHEVGNSSFVRSSTSDQVQSIPFTRSSTSGQAYATSLDKVTANEQVMHTLPNRANNNQSINTFWHTKTDSYSGGNQGYQVHGHPHSNLEGLSSNIIVTSAEEDQQYNMQKVMSSEDMWYKQSFTREDVITGLKDKEPGHFYIRNSSTFAGAYGLALKVASLPENAIQTNDAKGDLVRHFLIETIQEDSINGVRLKGFKNESIYPSLAHFVLAHCQNAFALPHTLILPKTSFVRMDHANGGSAQTQNQSQSSHQQQQQMQFLMAPSLSQSHRSLSSPGVNFMTLNHPNPLHQNYVTNAMYLGKVDIDRLTGNDAIEHAVDKITSKSMLKTSTVQIELDSTRGITLNDKMQKLFCTRQFPAQHVLYVGFDPKNREFSSPFLQCSGINRGRIMGIIVKIPKLVLRENTVHLFCEIDGMTNLNDVLIFIKENYLRRV